MINTRTETAVTQKPDLPVAARLAAALQALPVGIVLFDPGHTLLMATPAVADLLPELAPLLTPGQALATLFDMAPGDPPMVLHRRAAAALGSRHIALAAHRTPDGGVLVLVRDETEDRRDELRLTNVIEAGTVGTWEWDMDTGRLRVNDRWITMLGHVRADLEPITIDTWRRLLHPIDHEAMAGMLPLLVGRKIGEFDMPFRMRHAAGHWVWVQSRGRVLRWTKPDMPQLIAGVHMDVSAQKTAEQRLEHIIEGAQVGTWQYDERRGTNQINARWAEMLGYSLAGLTPMDADLFGSLLHPEDRLNLLDEQNRRLSNGAWTFDNEIRLRHKAGHWIWVLSRGLVTEWDAAGQPLVTSGVHIDISERKALEQTLARERDFLAGLMETSMSGIIALNVEGLVIFANREAETVMGRPLADLLGKSCTCAEWGLTDGTGAPASREKSPFFRARDTGTPQRGMKLGLLWPDGSRRLLLVNSAPVSLGGSMTSVVCAVTDITKAEAAAAALRDAKRRAEAGNRAKSEFLANMSHEIRTPLNGVLGMADVLAATLTTPDQRSMIETIQQSGAHLLTILNDILDLAKIESGRMTVEARPFVPADLARRVEAMHAPKAREKGVDLVLLCDTGAGQARVGDAQRVAQVLHNLVGNAVKFTQSGEVRLTITARVTGALVIEVADTGIGMTAEQTGQAFQPFMQADGSITRRFGGTGLGLPIVSNLVALMGGTLRLDSLPGQGTRVRVDLPLPLAPVVATAPVVLLPGLGRLRALVAEDNATNRVILRSMLQALGMSHTVVEDGDEAVALWQPDRFDILLLDISMPRRDGISALRGIRDRAAGLGVSCPPALAVTANAMTQHVTEYLAAGFAGCVAKPIRLEDLAGAIALAVSEPEPG